MLTNTLKFWLYLIFLIPSIFCSLFVLYHLLFNRTFRRALYNHIIIVLLIISLICEITIFPWMIHFYHYNGIWERSYIFCQIWTFIAYGFIITFVILLAWATIERHILIFHNRWISTKIQRLFIHYIPIILLLLYSVIFYINVIFFAPCDTILEQSRHVCFHPCLLYVNAFVIWDGIIHQILFGLVIVVFSIALLLRVLWHKYQIHRAVQWRKQRKMAIQLLYISFVFALFYFPFQVVYILSLSGVPYSALATYFDDTGFFAYFIVLLFPFVCVVSLPKLRTKFLNIFYPHRQTRSIQPDVLFVKTTMNNRVYVQ